MTVEAQAQQRRPSFPFTGKTVEEKTDQSAGL